MLEDGLMIPTIPGRAECERVILQELVIDALYIVEDERTAKFIEGEISGDPILVSAFACQILPRVLAREDLSREERSSVACLVNDLYRIDTMATNIPVDRLAPDVIDLVTTSAIESLGGVALLMGRLRGV